MSDKETSHSFMDKRCEQCGGVKASLVTPDMIVDGLKVMESWTLCHGHPEPAQVGTFMPIMCTGVGPELYVLPEGSSIIPNEIIPQLPPLIVPQITMKKDGE